MGKYIPKSGPNAGKENFERVKRLFKESPEKTGLEIAKELKLSPQAVYRHLAKLR